MCDTRTDALIRLARDGADTEYELRRTLADIRRHRPSFCPIKEAKKELEKRGDIGALQYLALHEPPTPEEEAWARKLVEEGR